MARGVKGSGKGAAEAESVEAVKARLLLKRGELTTFINYLQEVQGQIDKGVEILEAVAAYGKEVDELLKISPELESLYYLISSQAIEAASRLLATSAVSVAKPAKSAKPAPKPSPRKQGKPGKVDFSKGVSRMAAKVISAAFKAGRAPTAIYAEALERAYGVNWGEKSLSFPTGPGKFVTVTIGQDYNLGGNGQLLQHVSRAVEVLTGLREVAKSGHVPEGTSPMARKLIEELNLTDDFRWGEFVLVLNGWKFEKATELSESDKVSESL